MIVTHWQQLLIKWDYPCSQYPSRWAAMAGTRGASSGCISLKRSVLWKPLNFVPLLIFFCTGWTVCDLLPPRRRKLEADGRDDWECRELLPDVEHSLQVRRNRCAQCISRCELCCHKCKVALMQLIHCLGWPFKAVLVVPPQLTEHFFWWCSIPQS